MEPRSSYRQCQQRNSLGNERTEVRMSTGRVPHVVVGQNVRLALAVFGLLTLAAWWNVGTSTSVETVIGTHPDRIVSIALPAGGTWLATGGFHG